jgi:hypothetical protein
LNAGQGHKKRIELDRNFHGTLPQDMLQRYIGAAFSLQYTKPNHQYGSGSANIFSTPHSMPWKQASTLGYLNQAFGPEHISEPTAHPGDDPTDNSEYRAGIRDHHPWNGETAVVGKSFLPSSP